MRLYKVRKLLTIQNVYQKRDGGRLKQIILSGIVALLSICAVNAQSYRVWEKSKANSNYPAYMGVGNTERGFAYGMINGNPRVLMVGRASGNNIFILNAATGDSVGKLDMTGISGGTIVINDAEVSSDGVIFAANLSTGSASDKNFKVYKWTSETAAPTLVVNLVTKITTFRLGDKITVTGSTSDNTVTIWAATAANDTLVKLTTTDNAASFTPTYIPLTALNAAAWVSGNSPSVAPIKDGSTGFYIKSAGKPLIKFSSTGASVDTIPTTVVSSGGTAARYFENNNKKYVVVYNTSTGGENMTLVDVTTSSAAATAVFKTPSMGTISNANGTGDIDVRNNLDGSYTLFVFGTNNGISAYMPISSYSIKNAKAQTKTTNVPDLLGTPVAITGHITSPDFSASSTGNSYFMSDGTTGIALQTTKKLSVALSIGDTITVKGRIAQYRGLTQIVPLDSIVAATGSVSVPKSGQAPAPTVVTLSDLKSEKYEGSLVTVKSLVRRSTTAAWPAVSETTRLTVGTLSDSTTLAIYGDMNIGGNAEPAWDQNVTGIAAQFSESDTAVYNGYELRPRSISDFSATPAGSLSISIVPEGYYNSAANSLNAIDTAWVYLASMNAPYNTIDSAAATIDSLSFTGTVSFSAAASAYYYIYVKFRSCLETWSAQGVAYTKGESQTYRFDTAQTQAYGNSLKQIGSKWCLFTGDADHSGFVDNNDLLLVDNDAFNFTAGKSITDIDGSRYVDNNDLLLVDNNAYNFVTLHKPGFISLRPQVRTNTGLKRVTGSVQ